MINRYTLPVDTHSPYAVKHMAEFLKGGGRLVLFAEGRLSRTGSLMKLFDGTGFLIFKTKAKVITAYLRGAERLPYSPNPGGKNVFPRVTVHFSAALSAPELGEISTGQRAGAADELAPRPDGAQQFEVEMAFGAPNVLSAVAETPASIPASSSLKTRPCRR
jgi:acyl-[acyl-carrier-protein]-phospholipid O-acyltransferase/long-chain-fatty-acid--[acyl-carrier-protein] ligase